MSVNKFKPKCIFLDLDGTIVDPYQAYVEAAQIGFQAIGQEVSETRIVLEIPKHMEQGLSLEGLVWGDLVKFREAYLQAYHVLTYGKTRLFPNVVSTIGFLSLRAKLALITMRHVPNQEIVKELDSFGIGKYFSSVMTGLDTVKPKPSPEAIFKCIQNFNVEKDDCLIVGDSITDIKTGKAAGIKTVGLLSGLYYHEELARESPDMILSDLTKLPEAIY
ncbi:MAG: HAD family hydrolase [Nitrososphaerota archaeon]|jgi:phosphoglycolate phosphatase|uniref:HAD family hydrolase n=1 Tax=Candidatus Bathycorpusculum sp. TaxID=2994959 RepID=UPI00282E916E|nr:HAD family hydrolase [Candidatus Termiticorpusculum sp.]MCL2257184.1 HAD family hydrolase [Candidatus Termiticorpusculum sp.]MCL2292687.1 HAD family hydrolase [Candidatus Termiticorpusculum sp.]MDR0461538.1 HAD family hydrolase [Nitrososphaerota archaeon]